jgi:predicted kinase
MPGGIGGTGTSESAACRGRSSTSQLYEGTLLAGDRPYGCGDALVRDNCAMSFDRRAVARLVLICGLPGAGKTTLARRRSAEIPATRLSPDEWMLALGVGLWDDEFRGRLEAQLWSLAQELLAKGASVVLDYGYWTRSERDEKRLVARSLGVKVELHYLEVSIAELEQRLEKRNLSPEWRDSPITRDHLEVWSTIFEAPGPEELSQFDS